jgi:hypothetical protein
MLQALLRARMPQRAVIADLGTPQKLRRYGRAMLRALPFQTIGDIVRYGLELHVYCSRCYATRRLDLEVNTAMHGRAFAMTRLRCRRCGTPGVPKIRPAALLQVGGPVTLAFLWCSRCIWEIDQAQLHKPPWSGSSQHYRCPGCRGPVEWHIHRPAWRPASSSALRMIWPDHRPASPFEALLVKLLARSRRRSLVFFSTATDTYSGGRLT